MTEVMKVVLVFQVAVLYVFLQQCYFRFYRRLLRDQNKVNVNGTFHSSRLTTVNFFRSKTFSEIPES